MIVNGFSMVFFSFRSECLGFIISLLLGPFHLLWHKKLRPMPRKPSGKSAHTDYLIWVAHPDRLAEHHNYGWQQSTMIVLDRDDGLDFRLVKRYLPVLSKWQLNNDIIGIEPAVWVWVGPDMQLLPCVDMARGQQGFIPYTYSMQVALAFCCVITTAFRVLLYTWQEAHIIIY